MEEIKIEQNKNDNGCDIAPGELNEYVFANQNPKLDDQIVKQVQHKTIDILCKCVKPKNKKTKSTSETGLVIGYVQSGKTLSFTSVISMAADNDYKVVIVLAGRDNLLLEQTNDRLKTDLGKKKNKKKYAFFSNPRENSINDLHNKLTSSRKPTIVITILKHQLYLNDLANIFSKLKISTVVKNLGTLIIDDESDQASLNTKAAKNASNKNSTSFIKDEYSAIYEGIINLKASLKSHSYIQYTATPQGNLLYDFVDELSPDWHTVLDPGSAYTGGKYFFKEQRLGLKPVFPYKFQFAERINGLVEPYSPTESYTKDDQVGSLTLIREIPEDEKYHPTKRPLEVMPDSFKECLRSFLLNSVIIVETEDKKPFTSMIVHLHSYTSSSNKAEIWLTHILQQWNKDYKRNNSSLKSEFEETFNADKIISKHSYSFEDIYEDLEHIITDYKIHKVIAGINKIDWDDVQAHILIGGMKLDRGFTVENLTHTYMPRYSLSTSQADTIQQRCRFFGYKKSYAKYCRVYIPEDSICEYSDYVSDEEELRAFLKSHSDINDFYDSNHTLSLSPRLKPTRNNILSSPLVRNNFVKTKYFSPIAKSLHKSNNKLSSNFIKGIGKYQLKPIEYGSPGRTHDVYKVDLKLFISKFLTGFQVDSNMELLLKKKLIRYLEWVSTHEKKCFVINMSQGRKRGREIKSKEVKNSKPSEYLHYIQNPFSGKQPNTKNPKWPDEKDLIVSDNCKYKGIFGFDGEIVIQLHNIEISKFEKQPKSVGDVFSTVSLFFPEKYAKRYIALKD